MKNRIVVFEILLKCILGVTGCYLYSTFDRVKANSPATRRIEN